MNYISFHTQINQSTSEQNPQNSKNLRKEKTQKKQRHLKHFFETNKKLRNISFRSSLWMKITLAFRIPAANDPIFCPIQAKLHDLVCFQFCVFWFLGFFLLIMGHFHWIPGILSKYSSSLSASFISVDLYLLQQ